MSKKLYVGNLPFSAGEEDVRTLFERAGRVATVQLITDRETGQFRGFGFVEMEDQDDAALQHVISSLDGADFDGRALTVKEARPRGEQGGSSRGNQRGGNRSYSRDY